MQKPKINKSRKNCGEGKKYFNKLEFTKKIF